MKKYRIKKIKGKGLFPLIEKRRVQMKTWFGWRTVKEFGIGDFEGERAQELLDLLNEDL